MKKIIFAGALVGLIGAGAVLVILKPLSENTKVNNKIAQSIINDFESNEEVQRQRVLDWMSSGDLEIMGVVYYFVTEYKYYTKIQPPLKFQHYFPFIKHYFELCINQNVVNHDWINSRYQAGWDLVNWFSHLWEDEKIDRKYLEDLKEWIGEIYKKNDQDIRECIINATLEHLFENKKVAEFFSDWKSDPELRVAYDQALEWTQMGGESPKGFGFGKK